MLTSEDEAQIRAELGDRAEVVIAALHSAMRPLSVTVGTVTYGVSREAWIRVHAARDTRRMHRWGPGAVHAPQRAVRALADELDVPGPEALMVYTAILDQPRAPWERS